MRAIHFLINALQWVLTFVGILAALVWVAELTGQLKTFNVLTGSMTPHIRTGDLVVDRPVQVDQLKAGEVATLRFGLNGDLVTHRIVKIVYRKGVYTITMKGDANPVPDAEPYVIRSGNEGVASRRDDPRRRACAHPADEHRGRHPPPGGVPGDHRAQHDSQAHARRAGPG